MSKNSLKRSIVGLLQQAVTDIQNDDRIDALDSIRMAATRIRETFPAGFLPEFAIAKVKGGECITLNGKPLAVEDVLRLLRAK